MNKTAVIYKSYFGATRRYALWLEEELKADLYTMSEAKQKNMEKYQVVIIASGTYAGWMPLINFLIRKWSEIKNSRVAVLAVGAVLPDKPESIAAYNKIPLTIRKKIYYTKVPGQIFDKTPAGEVKKENLEGLIDFARLE